MAAVTSFISGKRRNILQDATDQADTGQTDWLQVPAWATDMVVYLNWSAKDGTTPLMDFALLELDPVALDDATVENFGQWDGITQLSAEDLIVVYAGPGITGIADDDTGPIYKVNAPLPSVLGFKVTLDQADTDEEYSYTLTADFHSRN